MQWALEEEMVAVSPRCVLPLVPDRRCWIEECALKSVMGLVVQTRLEILDQSPKVWRCQLAYLVSFPHVLEMHTDVIEWPRFLQLYVPRSIPG